MRLLITGGAGYLGTEVNLNLNYKLYPNLTATLQGAVRDRSGGLVPAGQSPLATVHAGCLQESAGAT